MNQVTEFLAKAQEQMNSAFEGNQADYPSWLPVAFVLAVQFYEYYCYVFLYGYSHWQYNTIQLEHTIAILVLFHVVFGLNIYSYMQCIRVSPGTIPLKINHEYSDIDEIKVYARRRILYLHAQKNKKALNPRSTNDLNHEFGFDPENENQQDEESGVAPFQQQKFVNKLSDEIIEIQKPSFCFKCQKIKPARAHHCKELNKCVPRMDHYCVWVSNCIGLKNHKYFILFLFYSTISLFIVWSCILWDMNLGTQIARQRLTSTQYLHVTIAAASSLALFIALKLLFLFNIWCLGFKNITTIEYHIPEMLTYRNPFLKGTFKDNMYEIFGDNIIEWFLPIEKSNKQRYEQL